MLLLGALIVIGFGTIGATLATRSVLRRRVRRAQKRLPPASFSGPAVLIGTSIDDELSGVGALALTHDAVIFQLGVREESLRIPLDRAVASGYRKNEKQRAASLRFDWDQQAAVFDVHLPGLDAWLTQLPRVVT